MRCSSCGNENPEGVKFCNECAAPFPRRCPSCGFANPAGAKFCGECATPLAQSASAPAPSPRTEAQSIRISHDPAAENLEGERKTVTALFADIKGSMDLMEDLDPEEARALVDPALKLMIDAVHRYDGYIVQSTGDGIFALFGAPLAHEDHPQRALYAALRMQEEMRRYSTKLREAGNPPIEARVGINTGETVVRSIQTGDAHTEYTPIGHSTSLASRMQTLAPTGSIAVTEATEKLCAGYFTFKALGPTRVKGVTDPVNVFEVTGLGPLRTRLQRSVGRGLTKFVGRQREMDELKHAAAQAKSGHGQLAAAMAEAGVGKSRLFFEFKATAQSGAMVLETFSVSHGKATAYLPLIELLCNYFDINSEDDERRRREKVAGRLSILDPSLENTRPYIFALLGIAEKNDPRQMWEHHLDRLEEYLRRVQQKQDSMAQMAPELQRRRTLDAIKRILIRESLNQPLIVIFEDLHWIDDETQAFLNLLADSIGTARILLLVNYRPEYRHEWGNKTYFTQLRLDPLGEESAEEMLVGLLGTDRELEPLRRLIIERTQGNPFFMEETVQVLLDEGALVRNGTLKLTRTLSELKIPPTVQAILTSRIDRLAPASKELLQKLAVLGKEFALPLVRRVADKPIDEIDRMLSELQLAEFVYEQPASPDPQYVFKHALTQEVAYNSILIERRKLLHERAAAAVEELFPQQIDEHLSELAHHYGRSGNTPKAIEYLARSAEQAKQRSAHQEAIGSLRRALELIEKQPDDADRRRREVELQSALVECVAATRGPSSEESRAEMERALVLAEKLDDHREIFTAMSALHGACVITMDLRRARELAYRALKLGEDDRDASMIASSHGEIANVLISEGRFTEVPEHLERALAHFDSAASSAYYATFPRPLTLSIAGWNSWLLGYPNQARKFAEQSMASAANQPNQFLVAASTMWNMRIAVCLRDFAALRNAGAEAAQAEERGYAVATLMHLINGWAMALQNKDGIPIVAANYPHLQRLSRGPSWVHVLFGEAYCVAGRYHDGLRHVDDSMRYSDETGERTARAELHRMRGELLLAQDQGQSDRAEREFREAIEVARAQSAKSWELRATMSLARLLAKQRRQAEARTTLAKIYSWFTEGFDTADLKDAKALLAELETEA